MAHSCTQCTGSLLDIIGAPDAMTILSSLSAFRAFVDTKRYCVFMIIGKPRSGSAEPIMRRMLDGRAVIETGFTDPCMLAYTFCRLSVNMRGVSATPSRPKMLRVDATREWQWTVSPCPLIEPLIANCMFKQRGELVRILYAAGITMDTAAAYDCMVSCLTHTVSYSKARERARDIQRFLTKMTHMAPEAVFHTCTAPDCQLHN